MLTAQTKRTRAALARLLQLPESRVRQCVRRESGWKFRLGDKWYGVNVGMAKRAQEVTNA